MARRACQIPAYAGGSQQGSMRMAKTALVTGGGAGIGEGIASRLAKEGLSVGVLDINPAAIEKTVAAIKAAGGKAVGLQADVSKRDQVTAAVAKLRQTF